MQQKNIWKLELSAARKKTNNGRSLKKPGIYFNLVILSKLNILARRQATQY